MKNEALNLIEKGFKIVPCDGKIPCIKNWTENPICSKEELDKRWTAQYDHDNILIVTGNGLLVIDCDIKLDKNINGLNSLNNFLNEKQIKLPQTLSATTGSGGKHFYFRTNSKNIKNRVNLFNLGGIDIRANKGGVVAPPSIHANGNPYTWDNSCDIALLPPELEDILIYYDEYKKENSKKDKSISSKENKTKEKKLKSGSFKESYRVTGVIYEGERNETLFRLGSLLKDLGLSDETIYETLKSENKLKCQPMLDNEEINLICTSIEKFTHEEFKTKGLCSIYDKKINPTAQAVYYYLWWRALFLKNNTVYVSQEEIGSAVGIKSMSVIRQATKILQDRELINKILVPNSNGGHSVYCYTIL